MYYLIVIDEHFGNYDKVLYECEAKFSNRIPSLAGAFFLSPSYTSSLANPKVKAPALHATPRRPPTGAVIERVNFVVNS